MQTAVDGKVSIAQGAENAGKVLGIGDDGNVTRLIFNSGLRKEVHTLTPVVNVSLRFNGTFTASNQGSTSRSIYRSSTTTSRKLIYDSDECEFVDVSYDEVAYTSISTGMGINVANSSPADGTSSIFEQRSELESFLIGKYLYGFLSTATYGAISMLCKSPQLYFSISVSLSKNMITGIRSITMNHSALSYTFPNEPIKYTIGGNNSSQLLYLESPNDVYKLDDSKLILNL